ncbi:MAG: hypothetical protein JW779_16200 [Candidatus Thorarchaeota archaeon]|nr:hypothetical protein [Candidatus Thorarchaeota archaeon]
MAEDLIDAVDDEIETEEVSDGLTPGERKIEKKKVSEREKRAEELRKQLRKRNLGMLNYRWPAMLLFFGGIMSIMTNFLQVMTRLTGLPPEVGFDTFIDALYRTGGVIYVFPIIGGAFMIVLSYFAYTTPKLTWLAIIPSLMMFMAGGTVYFLITFAVSAQPEYTGLIYATGVPLVMFIAGAIALIAIYMREKE